MAKRRIGWDTISAGDVVEFRYKGKSGKSRLRTCLILNERFMYKRARDGKRIRLVHALQFNSTPRSPGSKLITENQVTRIFQKIGGLELREERYAVTTNRQESKQTYSRIVSLLKGQGIYRTFSWHILKTRAAFIPDDFKFPPEMLKELVSTSDYDTGKLL